MMFIYILCVNIIIYYISFVASNILSILDSNPLIRPSNPPIRPSHNMTVQSNPLIPLSNRFYTFYLSLDRLQTSFPLRLVAHQGMLACLVLYRAYMQVLLFEQCMLRTEINQQIRTHTRLLLETIVFSNFLGIVKICHDCDQHIQHDVTTKNKKTQRKSLQHGDRVVIVSVKKSNSVNPNIKLYTDSNAIKLSNKPCPRTNSLNAMPNRISTPPA